MPVSRWRRRAAASLLLGILACALVPAVDSAPGLRGGKDEKTPGLRGGEEDSEEKGGTRSKEAGAAKAGAGKAGAKGKGGAGGDKKDASGKGSSPEKGAAAAKEGKGEGKAADAGAKPPLRPEDGDVNVGGMGRDTTCQVPDKEAAARKAAAAGLSKRALQVRLGENDTDFLDYDFDEIQHNATVLNDPECQYWLGRFLVSGAYSEDGTELVTPDLNQAAQLLHAAMEQNHMLAARALGSLFEVHVDADQAAEVYMKAIELGDVRSVARLAGLYEDAEQLEEAVELYQKAAGAGDSLGMAHLARLLEEGKGVAKDKPAAFKLYTQAAEAGDASALNGLGVFYEFGELVAQDVQEAARLYIASAEGGDPFGAANAARCFQLGIGVPQSSTEAEKWAREAEEQGIHGGVLLAASEREEYNTLGVPLMGGRPSRYAYVPISDAAAVGGGNVVPEGLVYDGADQIEGQVARYTRASGDEYFARPDVVWDVTEGTTRDETGDETAASA